MMNKNRIRFLRLLVLSLFALAPSLLAAQEVDPNEIIRVNTDLVVLDAQVIDRSGRIIKHFIGFSEESVHEVETVVQAALKK